MSFVVSLNVVSNFFTDVFSTSEQHHRVLFEEEWVINISVSGTHGSLVNNDSLGLPNL